MKGRVAGGETVQGSRLERSLCVVMVVVEDEEEKEGEL